MLNHKKLQKLANLIIWLQKKHLLNSQNQEQGNTLIIAITTGLLVLGATSVALMNSTQDKTNAQAGQYSKQALATAEAGVSRVVNKLNSDYPYYLTLNYDRINNINEWENPPSQSNISPCAPNSTDLQTAVLEENLSSGISYQIQSYIYDSITQQGRLNLKGEKNNSNLNSQAQLVVEMDIRQEILPSTFPSLYAKELVAIDSTTIRPQTAGSEANVICSDCTSTKPVSCNENQPSDDYLEDAVKLNNAGSVDGKIMIGLPELPDLPPVPTTACADGINPANCYILISAITTDTTLPRSTDINDRDNWGQSRNAPYNYIIDNSYGRSLNNANLTVDTVTDTTSVRLYLTGSFVQAEDNSTIHNGTLEKFALFGCTDNLNNLDLNNNGVSDSCINSLTNQQIELGGDSNASNVFIYAPHAEVGINGGSSNIDLKAVIWSRTWGKSGSVGVGSNSSKINLVFPDNAQALLTAEFGSAYNTAGMSSNRINSIATWNKTEVN